MEVAPQFLICDECGCASDEEAKGWAALLGDDPDGLPTCVCVFCPVCAAEQFDYRRNAADAYT